MKAPKFPVKLKRGSVTTRVYRLARGDGRTVYTAAWNVGGARLTRQFPSYAEAYAEAALKADQLAAGKISAAQNLSGDDGAALVEARRLCGDTPLVSALKEWRRACDLTQGNVIPAAEQWKARNAAKTPRKTVAAVVDEFCKAKTAAGYHVAKGHASAFKFIKADLGAESIDSIRAAKLDAWLAKWADPVTKNTYRRRLLAVWRWARGRGYLPSGIVTQAEVTERAREGAPTIGIINCATWAAVLERARIHAPDLLASAVVAGFAGLRRREVHTQTWEDINLQQRTLRVTGAKIGTPSRRLIPLCDAAVEWLMACEGNHKGPIGTSLPLDRLRKLAREKDGDKPAIDLPENAFRHSFISHRVAATGSVAEVALEAGNSPQIIHRHYRELVTKAEGLAWFAVRPAGAAPAEIISIGTKAG